MIKIYSGWAEDFTGMGMGVLDPAECKIEEEAGGMYELELKQPMDEEHRDWLIEKHRIIKAPAPVRESPKYELAATKTGSSEVTREIWVVTGTSVGVRLRTGPGTGYKRLSTHKDGTEVIVLEKTNSSWYNVCLVNGGESGYMSTKYLTFSRNQTESIKEDTPGEVIIPKLSRNQLFRIYGIKRKSKKRTVEVLAQHISYDLKGVTIKETCNLENVPANEAIEQMIAKQDRKHDFEIICECTNQITADFTGRNWIDCLLNAEDGIVAQCNARLIRDNYTIYILPGEQLRDLGAEIRYAKNMLDAEMEEDCADIVTRIRPVGKKKDGEPLYGDYVDSENIDKYPVIYTKDIEYDVQVGKDDIKNETQAKEKLIELAKADFDNGVDLPTAKVDASFVREELTEEYKNIANKQALHMYDVVRVRDGEAGIKAKLKMTWYLFDCLLEAYEDTEAGELKEIEPTVYGYEIGKGSISGTKILNGSIDGDTKLRDVSIGIAKIAVAAIEQLNAQAITAIEGRFDKLVANSLTTEELKALVAEIVMLKVGSLTADDIKTDKIVGDFANFGVLTAGTAEFDRATVKHLVSEALNVQDAVGENVFIENLSIRDAQIIGATIGSLCIKGSDGRYYNIDVDPETGNIVATDVTESIGESDILAGVTPDGNRVIVETSMTVDDLNATDLKAVHAVINKIDAATIDVDQMFAREAFIAKLTTSQIIGDKSLTMIAGDITNLQIGGVNLFTGTRDFTGGGWNESLPYWLYTDETYQGLTVKRKNTAWYGLSQKVNVKYGEEYTLSAWMKRDENAQIMFYADGTNMHGTSVTEQIGADWRRVHVSFTCVADCILEPRFEGIIDGAFIYICGLKLERGNKPTDWSAAPEDTQEEIDFATPYDSEEPPATAPAVGKIWVDRGVTPSVFRRWKGGTDTTERDGGGWETVNSVDDIRTIQTLLQAQQQNAQAEIDALRTAVVNDNEGVHVRKVDNDNMQLIQNEVLITQKDVNIVSGGVRNSTFGSGYVRLLDMIIRVAGGGLVIEAAEV